MTTRPDHVLLARFRLQPAALEQLSVATFDFVWGSALAKFMARVAHERGAPLREDERPPYRRLNDTLVALSPRLVHGFEIIGSDEGQPQRQVLARLPADPETLPTALQFQQVVAVWATHWAQTRFATFLAGAGQGLGLVEGLHHSIMNTAGAWRLHQAATLWTNPEDELRYRAIPSLLAGHLHGRSSIIGTHQVEWQLCQGSNRQLMIVSNPQTSQFTKWDGTPTQGIFAYTLSFAIQTQAGAKEPWIHLYVSCRRYPDAGVKSINFSRDVTVLVGTQSPRLHAWSVEPTLVRLRLHASRHLESVEWADRLPELLAQLHARDLADPRAILQTPTPFRSLGANPFGDTYFPLYAEGFRPKHPLKTGFAIEENRQVVRTICDEYAGMLVPGDALARDPVTAKQHRVFALRYPVRLQKHMQTAYTSHIVSRLRLATGNHPLFIAVCWQHEATRDAVLAELRKLLGMGIQEDWPAGVVVVVQRIPYALVDLLESGSLNPHDLFNQGRSPTFFDEWRVQMRRAHSERQRRWAQDVWQTLFTPPEAVRLALIEIPDWSRAPESQGPRDAIRASVLLNWQGTAQFLQPMVLRPDPETHQEELRGESKGRLMHAVSDLVIRHTATLSDELIPLYTRAAHLPESLAQHLLVTGLYRVRRQATADTPAVDYAIATRLLPDGTVRMRLPQVQDGAWLTGYEANRWLGVARARGRALALKPEDLVMFLREVVLEETSQPHLVLMLAQQWRNRIWPQLQNRRLLRPNELDFTADLASALPPLRIIVPADRPHLRVMRLRQRGTSGETAQYIATQGRTTWDAVQDVKLVRTAAGFVDMAVISPFFHYVSIADLPETARQQNSQTRSPKHGSGGGLAFKYQTILEIVPFFYQNGDDPLVWAQVPHSLRRSPSWGEGGLAMPYPLHIAAATLNNYLPMIASDEE